MDGHCPQERWVSSITSCSHQPLLRLLATSLPEQTDSNQIFPIRPRMKLSSLSLLQKNIYIFLFMLSNATQHFSAWMAMCRQSQIIEFLMASACSWFDSFPSTRAPPENREGSGADITIKLPLIPIWSGMVGGEIRGKSQFSRELL